MDQHLDAVLMLYSQNRYDFNPSLLTRVEIEAIKKLVREKRTDFGIAPIGKDIFRYLAEREQHLYFEAAPFNNDELDAVIYMPSPTNENVFIILNTNQPLLNQIFATAHEYYHYLTDIEEIRNNPRVCSLSYMKEKNEQRASRFAAEFLLPDEALRQTVAKWLTVVQISDPRDANILDVAALCYTLTIRYGIPLKAVIYRLYEEGYIQDISKYMENYQFIKQTFNKAMTVFGRDVEDLIQTDNPYIAEIMFELAPLAYRRGFKTFEQLEEDLAILQIDATVALQDVIEAYAEGDEGEDNESVLTPEAKSALFNKLTGRN